MEQFIGNDLLTYNPPIIKEPNSVNTNNQNIVSPINDIQYGIRDNNTSVPQTATSTDPIVTISPNYHTVGPSYRKVLGINPSGGTPTLRDSDISSSLTTLEDNLQNDISSFTKTKWAAYLIIGILALLILKGLFK